MLPVSGNKQVIANGQFNHFAIIKSNRSTALKYNNPFVLRLVVPETIRRTMPRRNNPLNTNAGRTGQDANQFVNA